MGYTTDFEGEFVLDKPLTQEQKDYLTKFAESRRMKRNVEKLQHIIDQKPHVAFSHTSVGLPLGTDGEFFVDGEGFMGQEKDDSVVDYNHPPVTQPGLWCQWTPQDNQTILWDGGEKFYSYVEWIKYMINNFFKPWGINLNGRVEWYGEDRSDMGVIIIDNNTVSVKRGKVVFPE